jgi:hypothetical protein
VAEPYESPQDGLLREIDALRKSQDDLLREIDALRKPFDGALDQRTRVHRIVAASHVACRG